VTPYDGKPATVGIGVMVALGVDSRATVDRVERARAVLKRYLPEQQAVAV